MPFPILNRQARTRLGRMLNSQFPCGQLRGWDLLDELAGSIPDPDGLGVPARTENPIPLRGNCQSSNVVRDGKLKMALNRVTGRQRCQRDDTNSSVSIAPTFGLGNPERLTVGLYAARVIQRLGGALEIRDSEVPDLPLFRTGFGAQEEWLFWGSVFAARGGVECGVDPFDALSMGAGCDAFDLQSRQRSLT